MKSVICLLPLVAGSLLLCSTPVAAQSVPRQESYSPVMICQGALPAYEGKLRKRPLALANEGSQAAYVTCGLKMEEYFSSGSNWIGLYVRNRNASAVTVSCTLVEEYGPHYYPSAIQLMPAGDAQHRNEGLIDWHGILDTPERRETFQYPSISCALPAGTEIYRVFQSWQQSLQ